MDGVKTYVVFGVILVVSGNYRPIAVCIILMFCLFFSKFFNSSSNFFQTIFQLHLDCRHQQLYPMKKSSSCIPILCSTSVAPLKETLFGSSPCRQTPSFTPGTTRQRFSFTTQQWRTPDITCAPMKTKRVTWRAKRKTTMRREYTSLFQVNMFFRVMDVLCVER